MFYYLFKKFKTNGRPFVRPRLSANQELRNWVSFLPILEDFVDLFVFNKSLSSSNFFNFGFAKVGEPLWKKPFVFYLC